MHARGMYWWCLSVARDRKRKVKVWLPAQFTLNPLRDLRIRIFIFAVLTSACLAAALCPHFLSHASARAVVCVLLDTLLCASLGRRRAVVKLLDLSLSLLVTAVAAGEGEQLSVQLVVGHFAIVVC